MTEAFAQVLALEVTLRGIEGVTSGLDMVVGKFEKTELAAKSLRTGLAILATTALVLGMGLKEAAEQEQFNAMLYGLVDNAKEVEAQLKVIDNIASKGVFSEEQAYRAIRALDLFGVSVSDNIRLVQELGARSGDLEGAAKLVGAIAQGSTLGLSRRLREFGITDVKLRQAGVGFDGKEITAGSKEILEALNRITQTDSVLQRLESTLGATLGAIVYQIKEILESIGTPLLGPVTAVANVFKGIAMTIKYINEVTRGWASNFLVAGVLIVGLAKVLVFLKEILTLEKLIALWAGIRAGMQAGGALLKGLAEAVKWLFSMRAIEALLVVIETVRAMLAAAIAWAMGNVAGALGALALIAAAVGVGVHVANQANNANVGNGGGRSDRPGDRPIRRDDIERLNMRMQGKAWTG